MSQPQSTPLTPITLKRRFLIQQGLASPTDKPPVEWHEPTTFETPVFHYGFAQVNHPTTVQELFAHGHNLVFDRDGKVKVDVPPEKAGVHVIVERAPEVPVGSLADDVLAAAPEETPEMPDEQPVESLIIEEVGEL